MTIDLDPHNNLKLNTNSTSNLKTKIDPRQTAQYIADMVMELRNMAKSCDHITLQGLLEVCFYEAFSVANQVEIPAADQDHLRELSKAHVAQNSNGNIPHT
jgi:hypothetical protein